MQFAPRLPVRLLDFIERAAIDRVPIAEINRRVGDHAERIGLARPSYQCVRLLVHEARDLHRLHTPASDVLLDIVTTARAPYALIGITSRPPRPRLRDRITK